MKVCYHPSNSFSLKFICALDEGHDGISAVVAYAVQVLQEIIQDEDMAWTIKAASPTKSSSLSPKCLRLRIIQNLWHVVQGFITRHKLETSTLLLGCIMKQEKSLVGSGDVETYTEWATLAAQVTSGCQIEHLQAFWSFQIDNSVNVWKWGWSTEIRRLVWKQFVQTYHQTGDSNGIIVLLGVPFSCQHAWEMDGEDFKEWESLLNRGIDKAFDYGTDSLRFVDSVCECIAQNIDPTVASATRVADMFMVHLQDNIDDARSVPSALLEFVNDTLRSSYPPTPKNTSSCIWTLRTLTHLLRSVPETLCFDLLDKIQESLGIWISDESRSLTCEDYASDVCSSLHSQE